MTRKCRNCGDNIPYKILPIIGKFCSTFCLYEYEDPITDKEHIESMFEQLTNIKRRKK